MIKLCIKCQVKKPFEEFPFQKKGKHGLHAWCRVCNSEYYHSRTEESLAAQRRQSKTPEARAAARASAYKRYWSNEEYREKMLEKNKLRRRQPAVRAQQIAYQIRREQTNISYKLRANLNHRLRALLKITEGEKAGEIKELIGCSILDFIKHLESLWLPGMSWKNYGCKNGDWQLDHIIPCAAFDLADPEQQKACYHYTNVRPLWKIDNIKKGAKMPNGKDLRRYK